MRGELSPPKPTPSSPVGGEVVYVSAPNPTCVEGLPGMPAKTSLGSAKLAMVEDVEELRFEPQLHAFAQGKPFRKIKIAPEEIRTAQSVAAERSELTILRTVAAVGRPPCWGPRRIRRRSD